MNKIKYDSELMKLITFFESISGAKVKDCITNEKILFVIKQDDMGKAIGKKGANIKRIENALKKRVKLVEFNDDAVQFVKNMMHPIEVSQIEHENNIITIHGKDISTKAMLIGRERQNINHMTKIIKRYFDVEEIKVV